MSQPSPLFDEIAGQPEALSRLARYYASAEGCRRLDNIPARPLPVLVGMGASYHSGLIAASSLRQLGLATLALEATEALYGAPGVLEQASGVVYISQSGASGEIQPLLDRLPAGAHVSALTNDDASPLARRAQVVLPLLAGDEQTVATKTFTNSLGLLWLLARNWTHGLEPRDFDRLEAIAGQLAENLKQTPTVSQLWLDQLASASCYVVVGAGLQAITARHTAMVIMEWLKVPAVSASAGAFRHGPIEIIQPGLGVVVFAGPGPAYASSCQLAQELETYGARVLLVEQGRARRLADPAYAGEPLDPALGPILDCLPVQIFVENLAREKGLEPGFRHIEKVVTTF